MSDRVGFGDVFSDVAGAVSDVASSVVDDMEAVIQDLPGASWAGERLKDFANTTLGQTMLRAFASSISAGLVPYIGPQLATVAFAIPGLAKGDDFVAAWTHETAWRVKVTIQIVTADQASQWYAQVDEYGQYLGDDIKAAFDEISVELPQQYLGGGMSIPDATQLAAMGAQLATQDLNATSAAMGVRADSLQTVLDGINHTDSFYRAAIPAYTVYIGGAAYHIRSLPAVPGKHFDPATGAQIFPRPGTIENIPNGTTTVAKPAAGKHAAAVAVSGAAAVAGGSWVYTYLTGQAYGKFWDKIWEKIKGQF